MQQNLYQDIQARTNGEIYIGVVGPVRTGKSTFVKRFMDVCILPNMENEYAKKQAMDELPQSGTGKTITTTEPKFIPSEAAEIRLDDTVSFKTRLIDCVGYMVEGAAGHMEEDMERMVKTPWFEQEIPFTRAAEIGTQKVIDDHSTVGIVVTTDGSFSDIPVENYDTPLDKTITQLKTIKKPFVVLLNTQKPYSKEAEEMAEKISGKYAVTVLPVNCMQLKKEDIHMIMEKILLAFPVNMISYYMPSFVSMLPPEHEMKQTLLSQIHDSMDQYNQMSDLTQAEILFDNDYIERARVTDVNLADGSASIYLDVNDTYYYEMLSELLGQPIDDEYELLSYLQNASEMKKEYEQVKSAMESVRQKGYGVVTPKREEITLQKPEVIHHGNKYGVKIKAQSPSIHMIRANIETEIAPIVGTKEQAEDLIAYIGNSAKENHLEDKADYVARRDNRAVSELPVESDSGIWETNIFGKTVEQMVQDGINTKIAMIGEESQVKLQDTMQKIVNDTNGGLVCIII